MIDALIFPDAREALFDLIDGATHLGEPVSAHYQLPADSYGALGGPFPIALIYVTGGNRGFVDRVDRATIEVYAPGQQAVNTLESIAASIIGDGIETPSGFIDSIEQDVTPADVPYQSDTLNKAVGTFFVTSRPL
ncbi:hypothetical protein E5206_09405 [Arthrobacter sp. PAMC25564]|uniref:hypothetical protein n=1 Tax=Arthrobacter sp. PAMC25564 TaxID=2565366 RepID=UPI0010A2464C|nr:hypothetical protein [Arthrobacter sp. PAMC25564]QCB97120.1 hypothetical protein E5206_09405 [Arthrobacter sp. PAMC25564]